LRQHLELGLERQGLAGLEVDVADVRGADGAKAFGLDTLIKVAGDEGFHHLFPDLVGKAHLHHRSWGFAGPEAGNTGPVAELVDDALGFLGDSFRRNRYFQFVFTAFKLCQGRKSV